MRSLGLFVLASLVLRQMHVQRVYACWCTNVYFSANCLSTAQSICARQVFNREADNSAEDFTNSCYDATGRSMDSCPYD